MKTFIALCTMFVVGFFVIRSWSAPIHVAASVQVNKEVNVPALDVAVHFEAPTVAPTSHPVAPKAVAKAAHKPVTQAVLKCSTQYVLGGPVKTCV